MRYLQQRSAWPKSELDISKTMCVDRSCATMRRVGPATHPCQGSVSRLVVRTPSQLQELVRSCTACEVERCNPSEPMIASETVLRPWQMVGTDMFVYKKDTYLLVVDYASTYVEIAKLAQTTSPDVILHLRSIFARRGIPETVVVFGRLR